MLTGVKRENMQAFLFLLPSLVGVAVFYVVAFVLSLSYVFTNRAGMFVGFENFASLLHSQAFRLASFNTARFMVIAVPLSMAVPFVLACVLFKLQGMAWLKTLFMTPLVIPTASVAFFFQSLFVSHGLLSQLLGTNTNWLQTDHALAIAVGIYVWRTLGFNLVLALATLANIPQGYYEWAAIEGMGRWRMFWGITLVYAVPGLFIMFVMSFIHSFRIYRELYMLAGNYPHSGMYMLQHYMNNQFMWLNRQNLTTASLLTTLVVSVFMVGFFALNKRADWGEA